MRTIAPCFEREYLGIEASPARGNREASVADRDVAALQSDIEAFGGLYRAKVGRWTDWLADLRRAGRRAILWGAGARAVAFLSALRPGPEVPYLVDINPHRQGLFLPRTGQRVESPETLSTDRPDAVLITNPAFADEIRRQASELGIRGEMLVLD